MLSGALEFPEIAAVYARFAALMAMSSDFGGWLLLYSGLDREEIAVAMASNVAGAASLGIEPDPARAKQALRSGVCDFLVNNLDEALRILKNEIRQKRGVSVVLTGAVDATVAEMVERGVQPEVLTFPVRELMERGARVLSEYVEDGSTAVAWSVASGFPRCLPVLDGLAIASLQTAGPRVRWVEASPRYLGRVFAGRFLRMTDDEAEAFVAAVREAVNTGAIETTVSLSRGAEAIVIAP